MKKIISIILALQLLLLSTATINAQTLTSSLYQLLFKFETDEELESLDGGLEYYRYSENKGVDGAAGYVSIPAATTNMSSGFTFESKVMKTDKYYKLSFWAKSATQSDVSVYPVVMLKPSNFKVTDVGTSTYQVNQNVSGVQSWKDFSTSKATVGNEWKKVEVKIDFAQFTAGSKSVVTVSSFDAGRIAFRGSGNICIDNVTIEPYYEYSSVVVIDTNSNQVLSNELLSDIRKLENMVNKSAVNHTTLSGVSDAKGRIAITQGGYDGGKCFMGLAGENASLAMQNGHISDVHLEPNTLMQFSIWMKAPAYVTEGTDEMSIDTATGVVKTATAQTNGIIDEEVNVSIQCKPNVYGSPEWNDVVFVGSYDTSGTFTAGATKITSSWRQYVGYAVIASESMKKRSDITSQTSPYPTVKFTNAGVYMLDDVSLKYVTYSDSNMVIDGKFSITKGTKAVFANNTASTVETDGTFATYLKVSQTGGAATAAEMAIPLENGEKYTISYWAKAENADAQLTTTISSTSLATPYTDTKTITTQWQQYSFDYTSSSDALSKLSFGASNAGDSFSIADVRVKEYAPIVIPDNSFISFEVTGNAVEGHTLAASIEFNTENQYSYLLRVNRSCGSGYIPVYETDISQTKSGTYCISSNDVGKKLLLEVFAYNGEETFATTYETTTVLPEKEITPSFTGWDKIEGTVSAMVEIANNSASGDPLKLCVFALLLDEHERVLNFTQVTGTQVTAGSSTTVNISLGDKASENPDVFRLYIWDGDNIFASNMKPLIPETEYKLQ